jgi:hypothetical protein
MAASSIQHQLKSEERQSQGTIAQGQTNKIKSSVNISYLPPTITDTMSPRTLTDRSPSSVLAVHLDDYSSCSSSEMRTSKEKLPLNGNGGPPIKKYQLVLEKNVICPMTCLDEYTDEEIEAIWFSQEEYAEIKAGYQETVFLMESGEKLDPKHQTSRGLEYRTQEGAWARYENKRDSYNAVLDEQDRQWQAEADDYDAISKIYIDTSSKKCAEAAAARAKKDEKRAMEIFVASGLLPGTPKKVRDPSKKSSSKKRGEESDKKRDGKKRTERSSKGKSDKAAPVPV